MKKQKYLYKIYRQGCSSTLFQSNSAWQIARDLAYLLVHGGWDHLVITREKVS